MKGLAWLPWVTFNEVAMETQSSSLVTVTSKAVEREASHAEMGCAFAG